ncbi:unnamed protein product [Vitrella brassicaformis CCMP3155]|uniref:GPI transamidase subunit PIG-U n=1 Tax=Vitrella brassicaformis (strain CCMP3155) TaxID=1169540 RepID=A0A0G4ETP6_VITBC|nr:unnamed protein product [Vitrella brassicaformis CCMP3155]|eukprot:CEM01991.1 unnamed protein product [Vitrella brassicaformis CCMP3155]
MNASSSTASLAAIAACGVAIRALLFFHSSASASGSAIFFGLNTFDSLKETAFARKHGGVASAVIGSSPRVLLALERFSEHTGGVVDTREGEREMTFWVLTAVDVCIAVCLWISARAHQKGVPYLGPSFVAASYLLNPLTVLSTQALSFQAFTRCVYSMMLATSGWILMPLAAVLLQVSSHPLMAITVVLPAMHTFACGPEKRYILLSVSFLIGVCGFYALIEAWIRHTLGDKPTPWPGGADVDLLTPNIGLFWYLFTQIFDRFEYMFHFIFNGHVYLYVIPLWLHLYRQPHGLLTAHIAIVVLFQPHPTVCDFAYLISLLLLHHDIVRRLGSFSFIVLVASVSLSIMPVMACLWLDRNTGNANFVYFQHLIHHSACGVLLAEWLREIHQRDSQPATDK